MVTVSYETARPACGEMATAEISVEPEQQGGLETPYLPEHWELANAIECGCGFEFNRAEEWAVVDAARRELGR